MDDLDNIFSRPRPSLAPLEQSLESLSSSTQKAYFSLCNPTLLALDLGANAPCPVAVSECLEKEGMFWTWLEENFIFSHMRGDILILNVYCGAAIVEVCSGRKNLRFGGFSGCKPPSSRQGPDRYFSVMPLLRILKRVTGVKQ